MNSMLPILLFSFFLTLPKKINAHGLMTDPAQRGTLNPKNKFNNHPINLTAPIDNKPHFPAGDKDAAPGAGARSQMRAVPFWTPFTPTESSFRWRAGVCGDQIGKPQDHMRGGKFYGDGQRARTYVQGRVIQVEVNIIAHHNGFMELHVCDIAKCGGEISEACFKQGHCYHLKRAPNQSCDSGYDRKCAPMDPEYPHRWYLPCTTVPENVQQRMGGPKMTFKLPDGLACDHCVLHWFWSAANTCNPPGVIDFFEGEHGPKNWGQCFGQGGARGGYTKVQKDCGPDRFPEEYYQCADIRILPTWNSASNQTPTPTPTPTVTPTTTPTATPTTAPITTPTTTASPIPSPASTSASVMDSEGSDSVFTELSLVADGDIIRSLPNNTEVDITLYNQVAIEAITTRVVSKVLFYVDGDLVWTDYIRPYFMFGNMARIPRYWEDPIVNQFFNLRVEADGDIMESRIMFIKR